MSDIADHALAIANLKARYCALADLSASDPAAARTGFADVFTEDSRSDYGMGLMIGPQAITDFVCTAIPGNSEWMNHMLTSPRIVVQGDEATGDWNILVWSKRRENGEITPVIGRYSDKFRLTPDGWRITGVKFLMLN